MELSRGDRSFAALSISRLCCFSKPPTFALLVAVISANSYGTGTRYQQRGRTSSSERGEIFILSARLVSVTFALLRSAFDYLTV